MASRKTWLLLAVLCLPPLGSTALAGPKTAKHKTAKSAKHATAIGDPVAVARQVQTQRAHAELQQVQAIKTLKDVGDLKYQLTKAWPPEFDKMARRNKWRRGAAAEARHGYGVLAAVGVPVLCGRAIGVQAGVLFLPEVHDLAAQGTQAPHGLVGQGGGAR